MGAFTRAYWGAETAVEDLLLRLREKGFGVVSKTDSEIPEKHSEGIGVEKSLPDEKAFVTAWGAHPESRLKAK